MTKQYEPEKAHLYILRQGNPQAAERLEGVAFTCSGQGAGSLKSTSALGFWGLEDGDSVALTYIDCGDPDIYREDELIVMLDDIQISYKNLEKTSAGFLVKVDFVGDFQWMLGANND